MNKCNRRDRKLMTLIEFNEGGYKEIVKKLLPEDMIEVITSKLTEASIEIIHTPYDTVDDNVMLKSLHYIRAVDEAIEALNTLRNDARLLLSKCGGPKKVVTLRVDDAYPMTIAYIIKLMHTTVFPDEYVDIVCVTDSAVKINVTGDYIKTILVYLQDTFTEITDKDIREFSQYLDGYLARETEI